MIANVLLTMSKSIDIGAETLSRLKADFDDAFNTAFDPISGEAFRKSICVWRYTGNRSFDADSPMYLQFELLGEPRDVCNVLAHLALLTGVKDVEVFGTQVLPMDSVSNVR